MVAAVAEELDQMSCVLIPLDGTRLLLPPQAGSFAPRAASAAPASSAGQHSAGGAAADGDVSADSEEIDPASLLQNVEVSALNADLALTSSSPRAHLALTSRSPRDSSADRCTYSHHWYYSDSACELT